MNFTDTLRNVFLGIGLPVLAIMVLFAAKGGKVGLIAVYLLVAVAGATLLFMPPGTVQQIGTAVGSGFAALIR